MSLENYSNFVNHILLIIYIEKLEKKLIPIIFTSYY